MQNVYEICFYGGLVLAILLLIAAIVLFIVLKIPKVIGELTGSAAKKAMKEMQDGTASPGSVAKKEQEKYYNMGSGKITAKEAVSTREDRKANGNDSTELLEKSKKKEKKFEETDILRPGINDYDTPDGTGVRDYIHVVDLAVGHVRAMEKIKENPGLKIYNLGTGRGSSVLDIVKNFEAATGIKIPYVIKPRRAGDIATCYADASLAEKELHWKAERDLKKMCEDSWRFQKNNPNGY